MRPLHHICSRFYDLFLSGGVELIGNLRGYTQFVEFAEVLTWKNVADFESADGRLRILLFCCHFGRLLWLNLCGQGLSI